MFGSLVRDQHATVDVVALDGAAVKGMVSNMAVATNSMQKRVIKRVQDARAACRQTDEQRCVDKFCSRPLRCHGACTAARQDVQNDVYMDGSVASPTPHIHQVQDTVTG